MYMSRFLLLIGGIVLFTSCHDEVDKSFIWDSENIESVKMVAPDFFPSTRSTLTPDNGGTAFSWKSGDIVAVYSDSKGMTNFYIDEESISEDGTSANFNGSGFKLLENRLYYAFYPYNSSIQSLDKTAISVNYAGQCMKSNGDFSSLGNFDYMCAKGTTGSDGMVSFSFQHLGCVVEYKMKVPKTANYTKVRFELKGGTDDLLFNAGTVDITGERPSLKASDGIVADSIMEVKLNEEEGGIKILQDSLLTVYMMMPPQDLSGSKVNIRLIDSEQNWYIATVDGKNMCAGYTYHYKVDDETGGFIGSGTGLPDGELSVELISTYTDVSKMGYEGMILDGDVLYASGQFGVRAINYANRKIPASLRSQTVKNIANGRTDMFSRSIAMKGDYLYIPLRQSSSGENENVKPTKRFRFESNTGNYSDLSGANGISSNATVNAFFKELHVNSINLNQKFKVLYLYKGHYQDGYYLNTINLQGEDGTSSVLFRETFSTQTAALAALKNEYVNSKGDYCKVDWSALSNGTNIIKNVEFYKLVGEFDSFRTTGTASVSGSTIACPNTGIYSICMDSGSGNSDNYALLTSNLSSIKSDGFLSFWCKIEQGPLVTDVEIPLIGLSGDNVLDLLVRSQESNNYSIGIKQNGTNSIGTACLAFGEWYNFKIEMSSFKTKLYWRTKETTDWNEAVALTSSNVLSFNQLNTGIKTNESNVKIYFDDYYYSESDIDDVAYVNGKLAVLNKHTFDVSTVCNLDVKAIDAKVYGNCLVLTCFYGFNVYDISDAANPKLTYTYRVNSFKESQNCEIYENAGKVYVFICNYSQGYTIADVTDINNVSIVCVNDYRNITYNGEKMYGKIYNFDVCIDYPYAYLTNATMRSYLHTDADRRGILTVNLVDFDNPNPYFSFVPSALLTTVTTGDPRPTHIVRSGNRLIINNAEKGLLVFNIENGIPVYTSPVIIPGKPSVNDVYVPYDGCVFVNDNSHGGSVWPDRNVYLLEGF